MKLITEYINNGSTLNKKRRNLYISGFILTNEYLMELT